MRFMSEVNVRSLMQDQVAANTNSAIHTHQDSEFMGLRALEGVTYFSVSDENGLMDDDLFDLLLEEEALGH